MQAPAPPGMLRTRTAGLSVSGAECTHHQPETSDSFRPRIKSYSECDSCFCKVSPGLRRLSEWATISGASALHLPVLTGTPTADSSKKSPCNLLPRPEGVMVLSDLKSEMHDAADLQNELVPILCRILEKTVKQSDALNLAAAYVGHADGQDPLEGTLQERFYCPHRETLPCSVTAYVVRIWKYVGKSSADLVVALIYLERLAAKVPTCKLTSLNFQRLFLCAAFLAAKFCHDCNYTIKHWAAIGGLSVEEVKDLEIAFLFLTAFDLNVTEDQYKACVLKLLADGDATCNCCENKRLAPVTSSILPAVPVERKAQDHKSDWRSSTKMFARSLVSFASRTLNKSYEDSLSECDTAPASRDSSHHGHRMSPTDECSRVETLSEASLAKAIASKKSGPRTFSVTGR